MNRNLHGIVSTVALATILAIGSGFSLISHQGHHGWWSDTHVPAWQADVHHIEDRNVFWSHADGQLTSRFQEELAQMEADQQFIQDVSALHLDAETAPELLAAARGRLWHVGDRLYDVERLHELGLLTDASARINQSAFHPELLETITVLNTRGLEATKGKLPIKPAEPVWFVKTLASDLMVWPAWMWVWLLLSAVMLRVHSFTRDKEDEGTIYHHVMKKSGQPIGRLLLFLQMAPLLAIMGLVDLTNSAVKKANRAIAIARHPNSSEVRRATKALATLKKTGASAEQIQEAQEVLREWTLYDPEQASRSEGSPSRAQRQQRDALAEVERLKGQLTAHEELDQLRGEPTRRPKRREGVPN